MRRRLVSLVLAPVLVIALALGVASWASGRTDDPRSSLTQALDVLPGATVVAGFTDWRSIRSRLGVGDARTAASRAKLADEGTLRDLTTRSVLGGLVEEMHDKLGWSAADVDWEAFSRGGAGSAMAARLSDDVSFDAVVDRLDRLGYTRQGGLWVLGPDDAAVLSPQAADTLAVVAVVRDRHLVVAADRPGPVDEVLETVSGGAPSALDNRPLADVAQALAGSDSVVVQGRAFGCRATSVDVTDPTVLAQARAAVARAGRLTSPTFTGRGLVGGRRDQTIRFAAAFASPAEATEQLRVRSALTTGPFIGRSGRVEDTLDLRGASVDGTVATLRFTVDPERAAYMSGEGPLLFAGCPVARG